MLQQLRQEERDRAWYIVDWPVRLDKRTGLKAQTARLESGRYLLQRGVPWLGAFRRELLTFPNGRHDDQTNSLELFFGCAPPDSTTL
ncbi:hypothetical protein ACSD7O_24170 [Methylorubrum extorquens]|uniref:hypothetical protein n=1 Tax=Methylorubrum extorquens TaxID=408 RepID=UPI003F6136AB